MKPCGSWRSFVVLVVLLAACRPESQVGTRSLEGEPRLTTPRPVGPTPSPIVGETTALAAAAAYTPGIGTEGQTPAPDRAPALGVTAPTTSRTGQAIMEAFTSAGLPIANVKPVVLDPRDPAPRGFTEHLSFETPGLAPRGTGGQIFVCDTVMTCDAIYAYFDARRAEAGPYLYRGAAGTVVAQFAGGMRPTDAARFGAVLQTLQ